VEGGTGPVEVLGLLNDAGANGIAFDVAEGGVEVGSAEGAGEEAVLPEVACAESAGIKVLSVAAVGATESGGQGVGSVGDDDEVDVVGHEAVGEDAEARMGRVQAEEFEVDLAVGVVEEDKLAIGAALSDVMGDAWFDAAGESGHTWK
jgi:hypothetical protein